MTEDQMRAEFEAWARSRAIDLWMHPDGSGKYYGRAAQQTFEAWQASRASLCVELPKQYGIGGEACDAHDRAISMCQGSLDKAGVKYK